ncbi:hypothetical protein [Planctomyces sp. SH-PL62]|uniref:hypothetical protein n=1 Tax=Planctomyces sp. SH-PL62 TaxID=1636152 RepID=UPI00078BE690|nr:hypothetical protein [Planctomyces sp. SH-PL62]AMV38593.1 hypothetical protein VT85_14240 [Planctomyces sp. SH-PL62]
MTHRRASLSLFALRLGVFLAAGALALASPSNARAGCVGLAHRGSDQTTDVLGLSPDLIDAARAAAEFGDAPLKPGGCTGAFCSKPINSGGMDFSGGVDLRVELWAHAVDRADLLGPGRSRTILASVELHPILRRDLIFHPPR